MTEPRVNHLVPDPLFQAAVALLEAARRAESNGGDEENLKNARELRRVIRELRGCAVVKVKAKERGI